MAPLKILTVLFLLPGNIVLRKLGVSEEQDGGILRSMINMLVWGAVCVAFILPRFLA